jgi:hypothetical protein
MITEVYILTPHGEEDDCEIIGVFDSPEAAYKEMEVGLIYEECLFLPEIHPDLYGQNAAWPTVEDSPYYGSKIFIWVWDSFLERHQSLILMRYCVKSVKNVQLQ